MATKSVLKKLGLTNVEPLRNNLFSFNICTYFQIDKTEVKPILLVSSDHKIIVMSSLLVADLKGNIF